MSVKQVWSIRWTLSEIAGLVVCAMLPFFILWICYLVLNRNIDDIKVTNAFLEREVESIRNIDQIKREFIAHNIVAQVLDDYRSGLVNLLNIVGSAVGGDIIITEIDLLGGISSKERNGFFGGSFGHLELQGVASNLQAIATLNSALQQNLHFKYALTPKISHGDAVTTHNQRFTLIYNDRPSLSTQGKK